MDLWLFWIIVGFVFVQLPEISCAGRGERDERTDAQAVQHDDECRLDRVSIGTLLDTAVALFAGGLLFIAVSYALLRFRRRLGTAGAAS